jgi:hypothetical protein
MFTTPPPGLDILLILLKKSLSTTAVVWFVAEANFYFPDDIHYGSGAHQAAT